MREPKTCTEMATEKPTLPAPEEQVSPAAEDAQANPAVTVRVPEPEMPAAGPAAEASAAAAVPSPRAVRLRPNALPQRAASADEGPEQTGKLRRRAGMQRFRASAGRRCCMF